MNLPLFLAFDLIHLSQLAKYLSMLMMSSTQVKTLIMVSDRSMLAPLEFSPIAPVANVLYIIWLLLIDRSCEVAVVLISLVDVPLRLEDMGLI